jgi:hypothetical protein
VEGLNPDGTGHDDGRTIMIEANRNDTDKIWRPVISCIISGSESGGASYTRILHKEIVVISDLIDMIDYGVEAPYVGNALSTHQMYLMSNCGNQLFKNSFQNPSNPD